MTDIILTACAMCGKDPADGQAGSWNLLGNDDVFSPLCHGDNLNVWLASKGLARPPTCYERWARGQRPNYSRVTAFCFVCRASAPSHPAPSDWTEWGRLNTPHPYFLSSCPECSEILTTTGAIPPTVL